MKDGRTYGFSNEDVGRIRRAVNWFERVVRNAKADESKYPIPGFTGLQPALTGASVAGGTITTPTSFTCTLMVPSGGGFTATGGESVTALNPYSGTIAATKLIWLTAWNNNLYVAAADCP